MRRLRVCVSILIAMVVAAAAAMPASAHDHSFDSKVTIREPSQYQYKGHVKSSLDACVPDRTVEFYRKQPGDDEYLGYDTTDSEGRWNFGLIGDRYYVKVTRVVLTPGSHRHVCLADKSPTI